MLTFSVGVPPLMDERADVIDRARPINLSISPLIVPIDQSLVVYNDVDHAARIAAIGLGNVPPKANAIYNAYKPGVERLVGPRQWFGKGEALHYQQSLIDASL